MKKLLLLLIVAAAGFAVWRKVSAGNAERDLWSEVTDTLE
ncbi:MAG: DLW-39 family protein [Promicromonosporaceae bacterium]|nr:DLW-39 family protein [Promicromonosporaceae bacterium]